MGEEKEEEDCLFSLIFKRRRGDDLLFSEAVDFTFEIFILKFRVVVTADVGVIEGVVVQTRQGGFVSGIWSQNLPGIAGSISTLGSGWRGLPGLQALLLGTTDRESTNTGLRVGGDLKCRTVEFYKTVTFSKFFIRLFNVKDNFYTFISVVFKTSCKSSVYWMF